MVGLMISGLAFAIDGFTVGIGAGAPSDGTVPLHLRLLQPMTHIDVAGDEFELLVRADVVVPATFSSPPATGLTAVANHEADGVERYLGVGGGLSIVPLEGARPLWSAHALAGFRFPLTSGFAAAAEVQLTANQLFIAPQVSLALEYSFGRGQ